ncbi:MAG: acetyl ornithine aminotransferase family protein [Thaumarchaeota archaeon]|nr:acetyl ornithine aminotransferase family protein [Nitrososphaerota archaeon]
MGAIKIKSEPPGPKAMQVVSETRKILSPSIARNYPLVVESAHDCIVKDVDGNEYIDFNSGIAVLNVGSTNEFVLDAVSKQAKKFLHYSYTDFYYENINELAEKLAKIYPGAEKTPKQIFYGNSGAEANEAAIKLARYHTKRPRLLAYTSAFHGRTVGTVSLTASKPAQVKGFSPLLSGVDHVPYPYCYRCPLKLEYPKCGFACIDYIQDQYFDKYVPPEEVAAFFIEAIQGEGGYVVPPDDYFIELFRRFRKYGILFVADEVQSGIGRTGKWFGIEHFGVTPDMMTLAKALCGGLPIGALVADASLMNWEPGAHASTFGGNPVSVAAGLATLDFIEKNDLLGNARKQGEYMLKIFNEWKEKYEIIGDVRGKGLMIGIEIVKDKVSKAFAPELANQIVSKTWKRGVLVITCGKSTLRIVPPLTITRELVDEALPVLESAIKEANETR